MSKQDSFFEKVYAVVVQIPPGKVTSYGAIGQYLGSKGSARMVGWAMNKSHSHHAYVPAHRVVNRNGVLTGKHHFSGSDVMRNLLESEGIQVENNKIVYFDKHFWDPSREIQ